MAEVAIVASNGEFQIPKYDNGKKILWWVISILTTVLFCMGITYITLIREVVTQEQMAAEIRPLNEKIDKISQTLDRMQQDLNEAHTKMAIIEERIRLGDLIKSGR